MQWLYLWEHPALNQAAGRLCRRGVPAAYQESILACQANPRGIPQGDLGTGQGEV